MAVKLGMVIDAASCIDCKGCQAACKVANQVPDGYWRNWIKRGDEEKAAQERARLRFQPGNCMQCDKPTCVAACPTGATYKEASDGVVRIDRELCIGCGQCIAACPYNARYRHPQLRVADKCDFCAERRAAGLSPACVDTCPTKARVFGDLNDPQGPAGRLLRTKASARVISQASPTDPNLYYLGDPGPTDWPVQAKMPTPWQFWKSLGGPALEALVGLTGLGVIAMYGRQLILGERDQPPDEHASGHPEGGGHDHRA
ncbi:MAG: 4Fe-4S dicluster domain-containing protein [Desulfarculus sp.]|nr:4Fe-4S dicluster domain-containing protein [Desulfarculus sp.]